MRLVTIHCQGSRQIRGWHVTDTSLTMSQWTPTSRSNFGKNEVIPRSREGQKANTGDFMSKHSTVTTDRCFLWLAAAWFIPGFHATTPYFVGVKLACFKTIHVRARVMFFNVKTVILSVLLNFSCFCYKHLSFSLKKVLFNLQSSEWISNCLS